MASLFGGPTQAEIWSQLAEELQGEYISKSFTREPGLRIKSGVWIIQVDGMDDGMGAAYTRIRTLFLNRSGIKFRLYQEGGFQKLAKKMGLFDIQVGRKDLDEAFLIQGDDPAKIKELLDDDVLSQLMLSLPNGSWYVLRKGPENLRSYPKGVDLLLFQHPRMKNDLEITRKALAVQTMLLKRMVELEMAFSTDPKVELR